MVLARQRIFELSWPMFLAFGTIGSDSILYGRVRLLRSLPLSSGRLAWMPLLLALVNILALLAGAAITQWITGGHYLTLSSAVFLIPMAGAVCVASGLVIRLGDNGMALGAALSMLAMIVIFETVENSHWPPAFWWLLGLGLMTAAFFMNRLWFRSSGSYRPPTGSSLWRPR